MGQIVITTRGSFPPREQIFEARHYGHANAVAQAIAYLSVELLPESTALDHKLHSQGAFPGKGWDKDGP